MTRPRATSAVLAGWFVALLIPSVVFKLLYVRAIIDGDWTLLLPAGPMDHRSLTLLPFRLLSGDVVDVALVTVALALVRAAVSGRLAAVLVVAGLAVGLAVGGANLVAIRETGALLTRETWDAAWHWSLNHPDLVPTNLTARRLAGVAMAGLWLFSPFVFVRLFDRLARAPGRSARMIMPLGLCLLTVVAVVSTGWRRTPTTRAGPDRSFVQLVAGPLWPVPAGGRRRSADEEAALYRALAWPGMAGAEQSPAAPAAPAAPTLSSRGPRHVVIIALETAPRKFYDLARADLPTFRRLSEHALVAEHHQTTAPMTSLSIFSLLTGRYAPPTSAAALSLIGARPDIANRSVPAMLRANGYDTAFIDSYDLTWNGPAEAEMIASLGFDVVRDARNSARIRSTDPFADRVAADTASLDEALARIDAARARSRRAFVTVATHLGHYNWPRPTGDTSAARPNGGPLAHILIALDRILGQFMQALDARGLTDDVILVVTGDHGLRFRAEFDALGEPATFGETTFHVPLLIHASAVFATPVHIATTTSHIDVAPTLLALLGIQTAAGTHHGNVMWDDQLGNRITFLPSGLYPGLRPVDALHWKDGVYSWHTAIDRVTFRRNGESEDRLLDAARGALMEADDVRRRLSAARDLFE